MPSPDALTLIEKLRQIAEAKRGDPMPECLRVPTVIVGGPMYRSADDPPTVLFTGINNWATPLSEIARQAADEIERLRAVIRSSEDAGSKP